MEKTTIKYLEDLLKIKEKMDNIPQDVSPNDHHDKWFPFLMGHINSAQAILEGLK